MIQAHFVEMELLRRMNSATVVKILPCRYVINGCFVLPQ
jgi:hypothetical protein